MNITDKETVPITELFEEMSKYPIEVKEKAYSELMNLELITTYCFGKAVDLTEKGRKIIRDSIDEVLEKKINPSES